MKRGTIKRHGGWPGHYLLYNGLIGAGRETLPHDLHLAEGDHTLSAGGTLNFFSFTVLFSLSLFLYVGGDC